jgi:CheY-like chemotaxis protein
VLTEYGESFADKNVSTLPMPVHCISAAHALNGDSGHHTNGAEKKHLSRFTAPDANVLVVDDNSTNLKVANGMMLPYKMRIDLCQSGAAAIEAVQQKQYDMVFMDHMMPEMDGIEAAARIRAQPRYAKLPIIALTANAVSGMKEIFLGNGFNDFLSKPIDTGKLNAMLEKWLPQEKQQKIEEMPQKSGAAIT